MGLAPSLATHSAASLARCPPPRGARSLAIGVGGLLLGAGAHSPESMAVEAPNGLGF